MELTGRIKVIFDIAKVSEKFMKRDFVITTDETSQYPQHVQFQITQDKTAFLDLYKEGEMVKVHFNVRGREWNGPQGVKYFNTLEAWRLEKVVEEGGTAAAAATTTTTAPSTETINEGEAGIVTDNTTFTAKKKDDLPF